MLAAARTVFSDPAFRYGIKFGIAGVLAVFLALLIRLEEPTWALFTVFVLMIAQYVGAIAEKSIFRIIGTTIGAILGYVLTASLQQQPLLFLPLVGLIVAFCTAMFGQARYPYAFFLCGMTLVVVASNGLSDPDSSWKYALWRIEEVSLGILVAILVQSLLWPRFAQKEFVGNMHSAFADLRDCFSTSSQLIFEPGKDEEAARHAQDFPARISALRNLLDFGARESQYFRNRLPTYFELTTCLARIASAIATFSRTLPKSSFYYVTLKTETESLHLALQSSLDDLAQLSSTKESRKKCREDIEVATQRLEDKLMAIRQNRELFELSPEVTIGFGLHLLALDDIQVQIKRAHELIDSLPVEGEFPKKEPEPFASPVPPPFWIKSGIKAGIAVVAALVLDNWLNVPGGGIFVLGAWVFTALNATSPGGRGDWRTFHYVVFSTLIMIAVSLALLAIRPMLSSYGVMNTIIFTWLFTWGYLSYTTRGVTIPMQMGMLMIVGILGLNGQKAVPFSAIVDFFFGMTFALVLAAVIQRLLWPSLPQWELRNRFLEYLRTCRAMIEHGPASLALWQKTRIALIPGEAEIRIGHLTAPICPEGEQDQLRAYLATLRRVGAQLVLAVGRVSPLLPPEKQAAGDSRVAELEGEIKKHLAAHEEGMKAAQPPDIDHTKLVEMLSSWREWVRELRLWMLEQDYRALEITRIVGLFGRYEEAGKDLILAQKQADKLRLSLYMGDYVL